MQESESTWGFSSAPRGCSGGKPPCCACPTQIVALPSLRRPPPGETLSFAKSWDTSSSDGILVPGVRVQGFGSRVSGFEPRVSGSETGLRVPGFGLWVQVFGFTEFVDREPFAKDLEVPAAPGACNDKHAGHIEFSAGLG